MFKGTNCKKDEEASRLQKENSEQFEVPQAKRSASRRKQENLEACS